MKNMNDILPILFIDLYIAMGLMKHPLEFALAKAAFRLFLSTQNSWCDICKCYYSQCKQKAVYLELYLFT